MSVACRGMQTNQASNQESKVSTCVLPPDRLSAFRRDRALWHGKHHSCLLPSILPGSIIDSFDKPECMIKYLCSRLQLHAGRSRGLLDVGHNSSCIPRALIIRWGLCVSISKDLRQPPASSQEIPSYNIQRYCRQPAEVPVSEGCRQISTGSKGISPSE